MFTASEHHKIVDLLGSRGCNYILGDAKYALFRVHNKAFTIQAEGVYHLCFQYSKKNRIFIAFCFLCMKKSLNIHIHCGFPGKELPL